ncbi:MAG: ATP-dependent DNA helicase [Arcanobacterium sp.]|nr:ATP-dependent DNA helicase [Arcanobacterium sp.]
MVETAARNCDSASGSAGIELDEHQRAVLDAVLMNGRVADSERQTPSGPLALSVVGAPGSGKTLLLRVCVESMLHEHPRSRIAVLCADRRSANQLRNELSVQLGGLSENVTVRSITAFAYAIASYDAQRRMRRLPELVSGPEQDAFLRSLFDTFARGFTRLESFGGSFDEQTLRMPAFRAEFRDLITRAAELELSPRDLQDLGEELHEKAWVQGADVMDRYEKAFLTEASQSSENPDRVDHARLITRAAAALRMWDRDEPDASGMRLGFPRPQWDAVFVDDVQDSTLALRTLLRELRAGGSRVVVFGNPDQAVQSYRGGVAQMPALLARQEREGGISAATVYLRHTYRGGDELTKLREELASAIHVTGTAGHRNSVFAGSVEQVDLSHGGGEPIEAHAFLNQHEETAFIASKLRWLHFHGKVPYGEMAVITRSRQGQQAFRLALMNHGIPVAPLGATQTLRSNRVIHAIIELIRCAQVKEEDGERSASVHRDAKGEVIDAARLARLAMSPIFGIDALEWRRAIRQLHGWEVKNGGSRTINSIVEGIVTDPHNSIYTKVETIDRLVRAITRTRGAIEHSASASQALWQIWDSLGVAEDWREIALEGSRDADHANADLDAMMQLFRMAQRLEDQAQGSVPLEKLVDYVEEQDLPEDSIARASSSDDSVTLTTPHGVNGRTWSHVFIAKMNDGVWPNTALRNPLTHVPELTQRIIRMQLGSSPGQGAQQSRVDVIDDEMRMLLQSVSRARQGVIFTCVDGETSNPSRFLRWITSQGKVTSIVTHDVAQHEANPASSGEGSVESYIAELHQLMRRVPAGSKEWSIAGAQLKRLRDAGILVADDSLWVPYLEPSTTQAITAQKPRVSPSRVAGIIACPLKDFLEHAGGNDDDARQNLDFGNLIHTIAEQHPSGTLGDLEAALETQWESFGFGHDTLDDARRKKQAQDQLVILAKYFEMVRKTHASVLVEVPASADTGASIISGRLDRVEIANDGKSAFVTDIKTGKTPPKKAQLAQHPQLLVYQWLINRGAVVTHEESVPAKSGGARLLYLGVGTNKIPRYEQSALPASQMHTVTHLIDTAGRLSSGNSFVAHPDSATCYNCAFVRMCPAQGSGRIFS